MISHLKHPDGIEGKPGGFHGTSARRAQISQQKDSLVHYIAK